MGIFKKNENEKNYVGGEKHFIDVIKNSGEPNLLIWKQPEEDFNTNSKLIVMPGEMAIFVDGGNIVQTFENGTYQLSTKNYPFISRLKNALSGGISTFNCVVYFFRKADSQEIRWGTDSPIPARDKVHRIRTEVKARGIYKIRIENPALFLEKMIGSNVKAAGQDALFSYFGAELTSSIRAAISRFLNEYEDELIGMDAYLTDISAKIKPQIEEMLQSYGMSCPAFSIAAMDVDQTKYDMLDKSEMAKTMKIREAEGQQAYMETLGGNWDRMQQANILNNMAKNEGAGGLGAMGAGLGMGMATGGVFGNMANQMFSNQMTQQQVAQPAEDPMETLGKLKKMLDAGLIEQSEYDAKKSEILSRM